jgi:uncharacterized protein
MLRLHTADGHELAADIAEPSGAVRGTAVLCHPHPLYGGNRFNDVVEALFGALPAAGWRTLRFDFRSAHDHGVGERLDVVAAIDAVQLPDVPLYVVGYSFGALVALATTDERADGIVAVAAPLSQDVAPPSVPTLVLTPSEDQFCTPDVAGPIVASWPHADFAVIDSADHFLAGRTSLVAERTLAWLAERRRSDE